MISPKLMMFFGFLFITMSLVCMFMEGGDLFGHGEIDVVNELVGYSVYDIEDVGIMSVSIGFFTHGLPKLILWDYSFFTGGWVILRIILICILSLGLIWGVASMIFTLASSLVSRFLSR